MRSQTWLRTCLNRIIFFVQGSHVAILGIVAQPRLRGGELGCHSFGSRSVCPRGGFVRGLAVFGETSGTAGLGARVEPVEDTRATSTTVSLSLTARGRYALHDFGVVVHFRNPVSRIASVLEVRAGGLLSTIINTEPVALGRGPNPSSPFC